MKGFLKRPRYFFGQLLTAADLQAEQQYSISRQRLHNRNIHGHGVAAGLQVSTVAGSSSVPRIYVAPGYAIDCHGNEIAVLTEAEGHLPAPGEIVYLCLEWAERETEFSSTMQSGEPQQKQAGRIEEYAVLKFETASPCTPHKDKCKKRESCGHQHGVTLARLTKNRGIWKVDSRYKVCRVRT